MKNLIKATLVAFLLLSSSALFANKLVERYSFPVNVKSKLLPTVPSMFTDYYINVIIAYGGSDGSGGSYYALQTFISVGPNGTPISISASYTVAIQLKTSLTGAPVWYSTTNAANVVGSYPTNFHADHTLSLSDLTGTYKSISVYGSTPVQLNPTPILSGF